MNLEASRAFCIQPSEIREVLYCRGGGRPLFALHILKTFSSDLICIRVCQGGSPVLHGDGRLRTPPVHRRLRPDEGQTLLCVTGAAQLLASLEKASFVHSKCARRPAEPWGSQIRPLICISRKLASDAHHIASDPSPPIFSLSTSHTNVNKNVTIRMGRRLFMTIYLHATRHSRAT